MLTCSADKPQLTTITEGEGGGMCMSRGDASMLGIYILDLERCARVVTAADRD